MNKTISKNNLGGGLGLLAYYDSLEKIENRKKMLNDFSQSVGHQEIEFAIWMLKDYPTFLKKLNIGKVSSLPSLVSPFREELLQLSETADKSEINKKVDKIMLKVAKDLDTESGEIIKTFLKRKFSRKEQSEFEATDDVSEIIAFLLNNDIKYQNALLNEFRQNE